jgi:CheY-like chemotaxis protein
MRLLVAEDSDNGFFMLQGYVSDEGHRLIRAHDGAEAIEMARTRDYDLIVMDANMPLMDGYTATRAIREWESNTGRPERVPILLFSADDPVKQAKLGGAAGCSGYLAKPASKSEVLKALKYFARHPAMVG